MKTSNVEQSNEPLFALNELENMLAKTLKPVNPRGEFVKELEQHLYDPEYKKQYLESAEWIILIAASILSVFILLIISIRSIMLIISTLGILMQYKKSKKRKDILH